MKAALKILIVLWEVQVSCVSREYGIPDSCSCTKKGKIRWRSWNAFKVFGKQKNVSVAEGTSNRKWPIRIGCPQCSLALDPPVDHEWLEIRMSRKFSTASLHVRLPVAS